MNWLSMNNIGLMSLRSGQTIFSGIGENERTTYRLKEFEERLPNPTVVEDIKNAGHFIQEDAGPELAVLINDFIAGKL